MWQCFFINPLINSISENVSFPGKKKNFLPLKSFSVNLYCVGYVSAMLGSITYTSLHPPCQWQVVNKTSLLGTIKVTNTGHVHSAIYYYKKDFLLADLTFSKKHRQCNFGILAWSQPWKLTQWHNWDSSLWSQNNSYRTPVHAT